MVHTHLHDVGQLPRRPSVHPSRVDLAPPRPLHRAGHCAVDALIARAKSTPDDILHVFVDPAGRFEVWRVGRMVDAIARFARLLADAGVADGDRVVLGIADPLDLVCAWHASNWLGAAPVIYGRPLGRRRDGYWRREMLDLLDAIDPAAVLVDDDFAERATEHLRITDAVWMPVKAVDSVEPGEPPPVVEPDPDRVAFYALTQGSTTGAPRAIGVRAGALARRIDDIVRAFEGCTTDLVCSWLPINPRTALLPAVLMPALFGVSSVILDPLSFMFDPSAWLRAMHHFRATISSAPGRAYDVCARAVADDDLQGLDLGDWRVALVGGEMIIPEHLETFAERLSENRFSRAAFTATWGGAETLTMATCGAFDRPPVLDEIDREALMRTGKAVPDGVETTTMTVVGRPMAGIAVRVVDAQGRPLPDRTLGEVQIEGDPLGRPYGELRVASGTWLPTGDSGYMVDGALVVCGRCTDLLRIDGRQLPAVIVERALDRLVSIRWGCVVVDLAAPDEPVSRPVVIFEHTATDRRTLEGLVGEVEGIFAELVGHPPTRVVPVRQQGLPRAPNGQLRRARVLTMLEVDALPPPLPGLRLTR